MRRKNYGENTFACAPAVEKHKKVCSELNELYGRKNRDYGDSFHESWEDYGLVVAAIRIGDKYSRLKSLLTKEASVAESIRDTLLDMANYAIMSIMEIDGQGE